MRERIGQWRIRFETRNNFLAVFDEVGYARLGQNLRAAIHLGVDSDEDTLHGVERAQPPVEKLLTGDQEARIIATRLGPPPRGYANWTLRLLARKVVELEIVDAVSYETVRRTLKKTA